MVLPFSIKRSVEEARELFGGDELREIFSFAETHFKKEDLGKLDLISKALNEFSWSLNLPYKSYKVNLKHWLSGELNVEEKLHYVYQFNLDLSKTLDKLINVMVLSNVGPDDILNYYETLLKEWKMEDAFLFEKDVLQTVCQVSRYHNVLLKIYNNPDVNLRINVYREEIKAMGISDSESFIKGGIILNDGFLGLLIQQMWDITYNINKLQLTFQDIELNPDTIDLFHKQLMEIWLHYFRMLDLTGHDANSIGRLYSVINHIKIKYKKDEKQSE